MKTRKINCISYILSEISPIFDEMIKTKKDEPIDLNDKNEYALDLVLRYIYYGYNPNQETKNYEDQLQENICEIILLFDFFGLEKSTDLINYMEKIDKINPEILIKRFKKFELYNNVFQTIRIKYCDYIIWNFKKKNYNSLCYDIINFEKYIWCCQHDHKSSNENYLSYKVDGVYACIIRSVIKKWIQ
jgi:BTB/POZ domain.